MSHLHSVALLFWNISWLAYQKKIEESTSQLVLLHLYNVINMNYFPVAYTNEICLWYKKT